MNKILVLLCFVASSAFGQNIRDYYVTNAQADGMLYFIYPLSLFEQAGNGDLTLDITYKTKKDSATVNFSYYQKEIIAADSVSFDGTAGQVNGIPQKLFIETKKLPEWEHRYSLKLPFKQLAMLFAAESPFRIQVYSQGKVMTYHPKRVGWTKNTRIIHTILDMAAMQ